MNALTHSAAASTKLDASEQTAGDPSVIVLVVLPELTIDGELPPGVHTADWSEFKSRFGARLQDACG